MLGGQPFGTSDRGNRGFGFLFTYATELRTVTARNQDMAMLAGYYGPGTAGGGMFYWSDNPAVDNGGTVFNEGGLGSSSAGWRRIGNQGILNVQEFGARGDGGTAYTNDTDIIQSVIEIAAASASPKPAIYIPEGRYPLRIRYPVVGVPTAIAACLLLREGLHLYGDGGKKSVFLDPTTKAQADVMYPDFPDGYSYYGCITLKNGGQTINDIGFEGLNGDDAGTAFAYSEVYQMAGIRGNGTFNETYDNVHIFNVHYQNLFGFSCQSGELGRYSTGWKYHDNSARYTGNGFNPIGVQNADYADNDFYNAEGIETGQLNGIKMTGNRITGAFNRGISHYGNDGLIQGNYIDQSDVTDFFLGSGINCAGVIGCTISDNVFLNPPNNAIILTDGAFFGVRPCKAVTIANNTIRYTRDAGDNPLLIDVGGGAENITIANNILSGGDDADSPPTAGIYIHTNCKNITINGNQIDLVCGTGMLFDTCEKLIVTNNNVSGESNVGMSFQTVNGALIGQNVSVDSVTADCNIAATCASIQLIFNQMPRTNIPSLPTVKVSIDESGQFIGQTGITQGTAVPAFAAPDGWIYQRTGSGITPAVYVRANGAWVPVP